MSYPNQKTPNVNRRTLRKLRDGHLKLEGKIRLAVTRIRFRPRFNPFLYQLFVEWAAMIKKFERSGKASLLAFQNDKTSWWPLNVFPS